ncbi:MAG: arsenite methyltransferase [Phycisphaerales bacterium]
MSATTTPASTPPRPPQGAQEVYDAVRARYAAAAQAGGNTGCGCAAPAQSKAPVALCCGGPAATAEPAPAEHGCCGGSTCGPSSSLLGYAADDLAKLPGGADLGLGCGNPLASAEPKRGETVLDLGSGAGIDCFMAAELVGPMGRVIGVDMTPEMIARARVNASAPSERHAGGYANVEFRLGQIEALPVADASVDLVVSNCVVNLSPDKARVWREVFRVLRPGGRVAISDVVATAELPESVREDLALLAGCIGGAATIGEVERDLREAGFEGVRITPKTGSRELIRTWAPGRRVEEYVVSALVTARRPARSP